MRATGSQKIRTLSELIRYMTGKSKQPVDGATHCKRRECPMNSYQMSIFSPSALTEYRMGFVLSSLHLLKVSQVYE